MLQDKIKTLAGNYFEEILAIRRHLHSHPELSFKEFKTSEFIQAKLTAAGISFTTGHAGTGIVALIEGKKSPANAIGKTILLRADMDALPIEEKNEVSYRSTNVGVMHACGHDVHSACGLGAAFILNDLREEWQGKNKNYVSAGRRAPAGRRQPDDQRRCA